MSDPQRIVVCGGPMCGKSTYARSLGLPCFCTDPISLVREPEVGVTYLPEEYLGWSESSQYVCDNWLGMPGPWVIEGVAAARALRKWFRMRRDPPCDLVVYFTTAYPGLALLPGQERMASGVATVWAEVEHRLRGCRVEYR